MPDAGLTRSWLALRARRDPRSLWGGRCARRDANSAGSSGIKYWPVTGCLAAGVTGPARAVLRSVVVLGDGARWIWDDVAPLFANERTEIVDWFHGAEHVWNLVSALHPTDVAARTAGGTRAKTALWEEGAFGLLTLLKQTTAATAEAQHVLATERGYCTRNALRMQYPLFRQQGLSIGSGAAEGSAKHLVQQRLKRTGAMRWSPAGGHAILHLRCHLLTQEARAYRATRAA